MRLTSGPLFVVLAAIPSVSACPALAQTVPPVVAPPAAALPPPGSAQVFLKTDSPDALLYRDTPALPEGQYVCGAPCGAWIDPQALYRIQGLNLAPSRPFSLPASLAPSPYALEVRAFPALKRRTYLYVTLAGGALVLAGAVAFIAGYTSAPKRCNDLFGTCSGVSDGGRIAYYAIGGVALGVGIGVAIGGGYQLSQAYTRVQIKPAAPVQ